MSLISKVYKAVKHSYNLSKYQAKQKAGEPLVYGVADDLSISLYPEGQIAELLFTNKFEKEELNLVVHYLKPSMHIIDIGANIGLYSITADNIIKSGSITAFEPSSESYDRLIRNLKLNKADKVNTIKAALSDVPDIYLELTCKPGYRDGDRFLKNGAAAQDASNEAGDTEKVFCTTLDSYFENKQVDFIKIDIEGGELNAFKGAVKVLTQNPGIAIMFECTRYGCQQFGHTREDVFAFLEKHGLTCYGWNSIENAWGAARDVMDMTENFWAIKDKGKLPQPK